MNVLIIITLTDKGHRQWDSNSLSCYPFMESCVCWSLMAHFYSQLGLFSVMTRISVDASESKKLIVVGIELTVEEVLKSRREQIKRFFGVEKKCHVWFEQSVLSDFASGFMFLFLLFTRRFVFVFVFIYFGLIIPYLSLLFSSLFPFLLARFVTFGLFFSFFLLAIFGRRGLLSMVLFISVGFSNFFFSVLYYILFSLFICFLSFKLHLSFFLLLLTFSLSSLIFFL